MRTRLTEKVMVHDELMNLATYPTTRYQGSKRKILPWICETLKDIKFNTVLDGCGGSGSVSYLFKKMGKSVTYNDSLKFNYFTGKALIENHFQRLENCDIEELLQSGTDAPQLVSRLFEGVYYLNKENRWLDKMGFAISNMNHYSGETLEYKRAIAYHALFQACLIKRPFNLFHRKNLHLRTAEVVRNFGNKTTWEKEFVVAFKDFVEETNGKIFDSKTHCRATNESVFDIQNIDYDLVYLDVPYLSRQGSNETSNYLKCYHFLEGLTNYQNWEDLIDPNTNNLSLRTASSNPYFNKHDIYNSFESLICKFQKSKIVLSYKVGGIPSIKFLVKLMRKYKKEVYTRSQPYRYALNKQNANAKLNREVLIIGT